MATKTLDLGCGPNPRNPYNYDEIYGIDIINFGNENIKVADLCLDAIPFEDNTFDSVTGYDFLEHLPRILYVGRDRKQPFIDAMSETWRVLKPGGKAYFVTPAYPNQEAFCDPQHVNYISTYTLQYFCVPSEATWGWSQLGGGQAYGFKGSFRALKHDWSTENPFHLIWELEAIK